MNFLVICNRIALPPYLLSCIDAALTGESVVNNLPLETKSSLHADAAQAVSVPEALLR
jgi:hypothetical protein